MALKYKPVAHKNPGDQTAPVKYYAQAVSTGKVSLRQLANRIAQISTVSPVDTLAVLEGFVQVIPEELANGNIVKLGDFGSFNVTLRSEGVDKAEDVSSSLIRNTSIRFRPGKLLKNTVDNATFEKE